MRTVILILCTVMSAHAADSALNPHLQPLAPLLGKTFTGTMNDAAGKPVATDVSRWEAILNGQAVRVLHSVNKGMYGGETIIRWDDEKGTLTSHYFTTAKFYTVGTLRVEGSVIHTEEQVRGDAGGVTAVKAVSEILADGGFKVSVNQQRDGRWEKGGERIYRVDPSAQVVFKDGR